jgi:hypothetical protein
MMRALSRPERVAVAVWVLLAVVAWNGIYDVLITRGVKEYLLRHAMHEAGRGPDATVSEAIWIATLWASVILLAGLWTVRTFSKRTEGA